MTSPLGPPPLNRQPYQQPYQQPPAYAGAPHQPHARGPVRTGDLVATVLVLLLLAVVGLFASLVGVAGVVDVDQNCRPEDCTRSVAFLGTAVVVASPWLALLPLGAWAVVRLVRRRSAWWVALLALPLGVLLFVVGVLVVVVAGG